MGRRSKCCRFSWFVNDGVGIGCAIFTYLLIGYAEFVVVIVILLPEILSATAIGVFHATAFTFLATLALVSHSRAMCSDPVSVHFLSIKNTVRFSKFLCVGLACQFCF